MKSKCISVRSVTYAQKAKEILRHEGIRARTVRRTTPSEQGCGWCVAVPEQDYPRAARLIRTNGVASSGETYDLP